MTPPSEFAQEGSTVTLRDEAGRSLPCQVEQTFDLGGKPYALLFPIDTPVEIFAWATDEDGEEEVMVDVEDEDIDSLFATAKAVLAEQNLHLQRSAITLTVAGDLPDAEEENCFTLDVGEDLEDEEDEDASEDFQILATFFQQDVEYTICTPVDPLLIFAYMTPTGDAEVVPPEEFERLQPELEATLFDLLE
ncbi:DUF3727 domain-containing protein [Leptolyngbya sp. PCC 6406]|uniref:DUF3727 domain-containing protein n=1 Tax=Leptolyngbya sp. PCC 6406 TaxID=1173264 RepID=UPI0002AC2EF7|nr:DUF3727 domain-containing protein [Leptolyngbya sp. PCC 6406]